MNAWDRQPSETAKTYSYFSEFIRLGPGRTLADLEEKLGGKPKEKTLGEHSIKYNWYLRASQYDNSLIQDHHDEVVTARQEIRAYLRDLADEAVEVLVTIMRDPKVAAKTRVSACKDILDRGGIVAPRRTEVSGPDGGPIPFEVRGMFANMDIDELERLSASITRADSTLLEGEVLPALPG